MKTQVLVFFTALLLSINAFAISLQDAKNQGMVGEQQNGYLGVVKASPEANKLINRVNAERRSSYQKIAKKNAITLNEVANLAAKKAISATKKGQFVKNKQGKWVRK
ncbi:YdbL family protein [Shewanella surugensis]|uniref:YdbL family protein n=1 Tax=Shewanella surugensis TaxID=212020 RepID=A0ABT0L6F2_9GAMM|nr:YdbL family protein [Shewanella surugensis]MCL1123245.1 YdbL family protein [Shewanella surugensis]